MAVLCACWLCKILSYVFDADVECMIFKGISLMLEIKGLKKCINGGEF